MTKTYNDIEAVTKLLDEVSGIKNEYTEKKKEFFFSFF